MGTPSVLANVTLQAWVGSKGTAAQSTLEGSSAECIREWPRSSEDPTLE